MALPKGRQAGYQAPPALPPAGRRVLRQTGRSAGCAKLGGWRDGVGLKSRFSMSERKKARGGTGLSYFPKGEIEETAELCTKEIISDN